jgi:hypothetical protein
MSLLLSSVALFCLVSLSNVLEKGAVNGEVYRGNLVQIASSIKQSHKISSSRDKDQYINSNNGNNYRGRRKVNSDGNDKTIISGICSNEKVDNTNKEQSNIEIITEDVCTIRSDSHRTKSCFPDALKESLASIGSKVQHISGNQIDSFSYQQDRITSALSLFKDKRSPQEQKQHRRQQRQQLIRNPSPSHLVDTLSYHLTSSSSFALQTFGDKAIGSFTKIIESPSFPHFIAGIL